MAKATRTTFPTGTPPLTDIVSVVPDGLPIAAVPTFFTKAIVPAAGEATARLSTTATLTNVVRRKRTGRTGTPWISVPRRPKRKTTHPSNGNTSGNGRKTGGDTEALAMRPPAPRTTRDRKTAHPTRRAFGSAHPVPSRLKTMGADRSATPRRLAADIRIAARGRSRAGDETDPIGTVR